MSSAPPNPPNDPSVPSEKPAPGSSAAPTAAAPAAGTEAAMDTTPDAPPVEDDFSDLPEDVVTGATDDVLTRIRLIDNDIKVRLDLGQEMRCRVADASSGAWI